MAASILPGTVLAGPSAATQAAQPHAMPAVGGFTQLLAELQATPAATETVIPLTSKSAVGPNDPSQAAVQPIQTNVAEHLDTASIVGATLAHTQSAPAAVTTQISARKPAERSPTDVPSPSARHAGEPTIAAPPVPAPKASAQAARRALSPPAAAQAVISKDDPASAEQHAPAAGHDDRKARTETAAQDQAKQDQTQPASPPQPIVTTMTPHRRPSAWRKQRPMHENCRSKPPATIAPVQPTAPTNGSRPSRRL